MHGPYGTLLEFLEWLYRDKVQCPDHRPRDRPMEILALGVSRSGTDSLKQALGVLGYDHVYHGWDMMEHPEHNVFWRRAMKAKYEGGQKLSRDDWDFLLGNCMAVSDMPAIVFSEELLQAYPEAKVILSTRDVDAWYASMAKTIDAQMNNYPQRFAQLFHPLLFQYTVFHKIYNYFFLNSFEKHGKTVYLEYNERIREIVPKDRLLEYHVSEGWEPLCKWLRKDVPVQEMPSGNAGPEFFARVERIQKEWVKEVLWNMGIFLGPTVAIGAVAGKYLWRGQ